MGQQRVRGGEFTRAAVAADYANQGITSPFAMVEAPSTDCWAEVPRDVMAVLMDMMVTGGNVKTAGSLRLVCKAWHTHVDETVPELDLCSWEDPTFVTKFRAVRKLSIRGCFMTDDRFRSRCDALLQYVATLPCLRQLSLSYIGPGRFSTLHFLTNITSLTLTRSVEPMPSPEPSPGHSSRPPVQPILPLEQSSSTPLPLPAGGGPAFIPSTPPARPLRSEGSGCEPLGLPAGITALVNLKELKLCNIVPDYQQLMELPALERLELQGQTLKSRSSMWVSCNPLLGLDCLTRLRSLTAKCNYGVSRLPTSIGGLESLEELDLSKNMLWSLPAQVGKLTQLSRLDVSSNCLAALPAEIGQLSSLKVLDLSTNSRLALPSTLSQLQHLHTLSLNWIWSELQVVFNAGVCFKELHALNLVGNGISWLPPTIGDIPSLRILSLSMNTLEGLPPQIGSLSNLECLDLSDNRLLVLPPEIGRLKALKWLGLRSNSLQSLPEEIGHLNHLTALDLSMNQLSTLPASLCSLKHLQELSLNFNPIQILPQSMTKLTSLKIIELYYVRMEQYSEQVTALQAAVPDLFVFTGCMCPRFSCSVHQLPTSCAMPSTPATHDH